MVTIADYGVGRHEELAVPLGQIERYLAETPDWVTLRWIHVPVGLGLMQSSIEDLFSHSSIRTESLWEKPFVHSIKDPGFKIEVLNLRERQYLLDQLDVFNILRNFSVLTISLDQLNVVNDNHSTLFTDIAWRADYMRFSLRFWDMVHSDLPWQLSEGWHSGFFDNDISTNPPTVRLEEQLLSSHPRYKGTVLVMNPLRLFWRTDGFVLTTAPPMGVHHLHTSMLDDIRLPPSVYDSLGDFSALRTIRQELAPLPKIGYREVFMKRFIVLVITEMILSPHCSPIEQHAADVGETLEHEPSTTDRVSFATRFLKETSDQLPRISKDLKSSLDVIFQLKTIEQNELALLAESNNRAILAFTIVTIIFLPLSFFTSYFGMNLKGIVDTDRSERYFWAVCGTTTVCVVSATIIFGFKERLYRWLWTSRMQYGQYGALG
ncbi:MAG: hypothetical protein Q9218_003905 [Villophora microphyllina]